MATVLEHTNFLKDESLLKRFELPGRLRVGRSGSGGDTQIRCFGHAASHSNVRGTALPSAIPRMSRPV